MQVSHWVTNGSNLGQNRDLTFHPGHHIIESNSYWNYIFLFVFIWLTLTKTGLNRFNRVSLKQLMYLLILFLLINMLNQNCFPWELNWIIKASEHPWIRFLIIWKDTYTRHIDLINEHNWFDQNKINETINCYSMWQLMRKLEVWWTHVSLQTLIFSLWLNLSRDQDVW